MARVSEVLDYFQEPYLVDWKIRVGKAKAQEVSEKALSTGSVVDELVQKSIRMEGYSLDEASVEVSNCMTGWEKFRLDHVDVFNRMRTYKENMQKELVLGDLVGHPDFILGDEVCDLKTSKSISKSHWMQTAQYGYMWNEMHGYYRHDDRSFGKLGIKKISVLRLDKNEPGVYEYKVLEEPFISFWQSKFEARYVAYKEDEEFKEMMRKKLEEERLG